MRLINVEDMRMKEFLESEIPHYAILSHRWERDQEVSFTDFRHAVKRQEDHGADLEDFLRALQSGKRGWCKIISFAKLAEHMRLQYIWIDTCCIDKSSSVELSEAINSMYKWYYRAQVCIVFLDDVVIQPNPAASATQFEQSVWFTRGWTLQELLAPRNVKFYDKNWKCMGDKHILSSSIENVTKIQKKFLDYPHSASIAQRMCWASGRETSRGEDEAYCLLGLFNITMPLLYGEGKRKAFYRLQCELLQSDDDESLFAWDLLQEFASWQKTGLLAESPRNFAAAGNIVRHIYDRRPPYQMTNKGLQITFQIFPYYFYGPSNHMVYVAGLNCKKGDHTENDLAVVLLPKLNDNKFCRVGPLIKKGRSSDFTLRGPRKQTIYIKQDTKSQDEWDTFVAWSNLWRGYADMITDELPVASAVHLHLASIEKQSANLISRIDTLTSYFRPVVGSGSVWRDIRWEALSIKSNCSKELLPPGSSVHDLIELRPTLASAICNALNTSRLLFWLYGPAKTFYRLLKLLGLWFGVLFIVIFLVASPVIALIVTILAVIYRNTEEGPGLKLLAVEFDAFFCLQYCAIVVLCHAPYVLLQLLPHDRESH